MTKRNTIKDSIALAHEIDATLDRNAQAGARPASRVELAETCAAAGIAGRSTVLEFLRGATDISVSRALAITHVAGVVLKADG